MCIIIGRFWLWLVLLHQVIHAFGKTLKVHFMHYKISYAEAFNNGLQQHVPGGLNSSHSYEDGNLASENATVQKILAMVRAEPNSQVLQHVLIVFPYEPVWQGTFNIYQPVFNSGTLVMWFSTYMKDGALGPNGTIVVGFDEYSGGQQVAQRFCLSSKGHSKKIQPLIRGFFFDRVRFDGFANGLDAYCKDVHKLLDPIVIEKVGSWAGATRTVMSSVFIEDPVVDAVFSPDDELTYGTIQAAEEVRLGNLTGLMINAWHYRMVNRAYLEAGFVYADVFRDVESFGATVGQFIVHMNPQRLPKIILVPVGLMVPAMDEEVKARLYAASALLERPPTVGPLSIKISFQLHALQEVSHGSKTFKALFSLKAHWVDTRLKFSPEVYRGHINHAEQELWHPHMYFSNLAEPIEEIVHTLESSPDGGVQLMRRFSSKFVCDSMDLSSFPWDEHACKMELAIKESSEKVSPSISTASEHAQKGSGFLVESVRAVTHKGGSTGRITITLSLKRVSGQYFLSHLMPGFIATLFSLLVFWIPHTSVPARVTMGVIAFLSLTNIWTSLPQVGTRFDIFFAVSEIHCFVAFVLNILSFSAHFDYLLRHLVRSEKHDRSSEVDHVPGRTQSHHTREKDQSAKVDDFYRKSRRDMLIGALCGTRLDPASDVIGRRFLSSSYVISSSLALVIGSHLK